jgi:hypothetical protein
MTSVTTPKVTDGRSDRIKKYTAYVPFKAEPRQKALYKKMAKKSKMALGDWIRNVLDEHIAAKAS